MGQRVSSGRVLSPCVDKSDEQTRFTVRRIRFTDKSTESNTPRRVRSNRFFGWLSRKMPRRNGRRCDKECPEAAAASTNSRVGLMKSKHSRNMYLSRLGIVRKGPKDGSGSFQSKAAGDRAKRQVCQFETLLRDSVVSTASSSGRTRSISGATSIASENEAWTHVAYSSEDSFRNLRDVEIDLIPALRGSSGSGDDLNCAGRCARGDDFRTAFLQRLSYEKVWVPPSRQAPKHQNLIIFDWDDTLFCTTDSQRSTPPNRERLKTLGLAGFKALELAKGLGQTFIITNAAGGWVEESAKTHIPEIMPAIEGVQVISARQAFEHRYPRHVGEWKVQAFREVQKQIGAGVISNFISIGDSIFERDAARVIGRTFPDATIKTIKLWEAPTIEELTKELSLVTAGLAHVVQQGRPMDIVISREERGLDQSAGSCS